MKIRPDCCFCDATFATWRALAEHLLGTPCGRREVGGRQLIGRPLAVLSAGRLAKASGIYHGLVCWCGKVCRFKNRKLSRPGDSWQLHMEQVGGLARHILELTLGEPP